MRRIFSEPGPSEYTDGMRERQNPQSSAAADRQAPATEPKLFLRLDLTSRISLGPGKIRLLEEIARQGSISGAGRTMKMSYRRAWLLVADLNSYFREPLVTTRLGGTGGGKATVTPLGRSVIRAFRAMEKDASRIVRRRSAALLRRLKAGT
ncbi:MAG TPA: LysR family transcriptional regulator [Stellaceae bacterium]|nr:LysR family transcriptional regulator [Stellaceae bacterium]